MQTVVVGIDGTPGSWPALEHALHDSARRDARLRAAAVVPLPGYRVSTYGMDVMPPSVTIVRPVPEYAHPEMAPVGVRLATVPA